jgi:hypothetical protein
VAAGAQWLQIPSHELANAQAIDQYTDYLVGFIQNLIKQTVPYKSPSTQVKPWWNTEVANLVAQEHRAYHQWSYKKTEDTWNTYILASKAKRS